MNKNTMNWSSKDWDEYVEQCRVSRPKFSDMSTGKQIAYLSKLHVSANVALELSKYEAAQLIERRLLEIAEYRRNRGTETMCWLIEQSRKKKEAVA
jgi:hypothetical protein